MSESGDTRKKVFISYAREDLETAKKLRDDIEKAGIKTWLDKEDLLPGQVWQAVISEKIKESDYFIALLSSRSLSKRGYVQKELKIAWGALGEFPEGKIFIIPVRIEDCKPQDERLNNLHQADLFPTYEDGLEKILHTLKLKPVSENLTDVPTGRKPQKWKINLVATLLIAVSIYVGVSNLRKTYSLTIRTAPPDAQVRIKDMKTEYHPGIKLKPGTYRIAITCDGFKPKNEVVEIINDNIELSVTLEEIRYALTIKPVPSDSKVRITNLKIDYQPGIRLKPGTYKIAVSHGGFKPVSDFSVEIKDRDIEPEVILEEIRYALTINSEPADATVSIVNSKQSYKPGILLKPGSYDIQVSKKGYEPFKKKEEITDSDLTLSVTLEPKSNKEPAKGVDNEPCKRLLADSDDERFVEYDNGIILDQETNLMWSIQNYWEKKDWNTAITYCNNYKKCRFSDWRLPSLDELDIISKSKKLKRFSKLEVWATANDGKPASFDFEFNNRFSNISPSASHYVVLIRNHK